MYANHTAQMHIYVKWQKKNK